MNAVKVSNLVVGYKKTKILKGISFNIDEGTIVGYLGPNGAGKTTTILTLLGILKPWSGYVKIFGMDVSKKSTEVKQLIAVAHQEATGDPFLTVEENIYLYQRLRGIPKKRAKIKTEEYIKSFNLEEHRRKLFLELSPGLAKKVQVARCLASVTESTRLIILDEPTAGSDPSFKLKLWNIIKMLKEDGKTVILTTHNMEDVENLCDKVIFIKNGKIIFDGALSNLKRNFRINQLYRIKCGFPKQFLQKAKVLGFNVTRIENNEIYFETPKQYKISELASLFEECIVEEIGYAGKDLNEIFVELVEGEK